MSKFVEECVKNKVYTLLNDIREAVDFRTYNNNISIEKKTLSIRGNNKEIIVRFVLSDERDAGYFYTVLISDANKKKMYTYNDINQTNIKPLVKGLCETMRHKFDIIDF